MIEMITSLVTVILGLSVSLLSYRAKSKTDILMMDKEKEEIDNALEKKKNIVFEFVTNKSEQSKKNVLNMMADNVSELKEYYVISKQQARNSFSAALFICFFGIIIYLLGIVAYVFFNKDISLVSVISGTVVEIIAGLFFWLYKEATKQLSIYHQRLGNTEKYLIAYQMISEVPEEFRYEEQRNFINYLLNASQKNEKKEE